MSNTPSKHPRYLVTRSGNQQWLVVDGHDDKRALASYRTRQLAREAARQMNAGHSPPGTVAHSVPEMAAQQS
jgi:hypothetical protein